MNCEIMTSAERSEERRVGKECEGEGQSEEDTESKAGSRL